MLRFIILSASLVLPALSLCAAPPQPPPVRIAVVGLTHTHVHWILGRPTRGDIEIVGIYEPNRDLAQRYADLHGYNMDLVYDDLDLMLDTVQPDGVTAFNPIFDHLETVRKAAPRGIHVMVEKPLAVNLDHARKMEALAQKHDIHLLTNYETTWYGTTHESYRLVHLDGEIGPIRKIVVHDGHQGPAEIGVNQEFLDWLTDPKLNGGGALIDFGCYGANLVTWLMKGERPITVTGVTQTIKPDIYPEVDDEATIILTYPDAQAIIQASWNWPRSRKDMAVYGRDGYIVTQDATRMIYRPHRDSPEEHLVAYPPDNPRDDPFAMFAAVIRGELILEPMALSSLENNMIVMEILQAAKDSAQKGRTLTLPEGEKRVSW